MAPLLDIGLIGAGPWARMVTGPVLAAGPQTRVTGVWSRTADNASQLAQQLSVPAFDSVDALLDTCAAVAICVAPEAQPALAVKAALAGKTLLLEKPLGADPAGAQSIVAAVRDTGVGTLLMLSNRFNPGLDTFLASARAIEPFGGRGSFISASFMGGPFATGWRLERGAVLDIGPHLLDLLDAALGEIVDVRASGDPLGWVSIVCEHATGATSSGSMCCNAAAAGGTEVEVFSAKGSARYDGVMDFEAWPENVRNAFVAVANGETHPADVQRGLHLQQLIARIESQLRR
jgi:predicted dehydrogenase